MKNQPITEASTVQKIDGRKGAKRKSFFKDTDFWNELPEHLEKELKDLNIIKSEKVLKENEAAFLLLLLGFEVLVNDKNYSGDSVTIAERIYRR